MTDPIDPAMAMAPADPVVTDLMENYKATRAATEALCEPLQIEDYGLQGMASTSPPKWHLAHTSWFFETFVLLPFAAGYRSFRAGFEILFNSYYNGIGEQYPRPRRGLLSRPSVEDIYAYRAAVDRAVLELLDSSPHGSNPELLARITLGLHHEQQHQELLLTDLKFSFSLNPLLPVYRPRPGAAEPANPGPAISAIASSQDWLPLPEGRVTIGADGGGFRFDNECPRHHVWLAPAALAAHPVTNADYRRFIENGGYRRPELWLADGWDCVTRNGWHAPLYWHHRPDGGPSACEESREQEAPDWVYTLHGPEPLSPHAPVCHVSYYEADAYARWAGHRLPTEAEWEAAAQYRSAAHGQFVESDVLQPWPSTGDGLFGGVWEWTASAYGAYPGFRSATGAIGEYNGKFMCNQYVLRGGSCATPASHIRASYRNFFYPADRWQFSGIRLARDGLTRPGYRRDIKKPDF